MIRGMASGAEFYDSIVEENLFYIDKTRFIKEWWENGDRETLITRPVSFGKTLMMSMVECFFSTKYSGRVDLFEGMDIWKNEKYRSLQGAYPVVHISFGHARDEECESNMETIKWILRELYLNYSFLLKEDILNKQEKENFERILLLNMDNSEISMAIYNLCGYLKRYYGKNVIVLIDDYDVPIRKTCRDSKNWKAFCCLMRNMLLSSFKCNPYLERGIMIGTTWVDMQYTLPDLNNFNIVTVTSDDYADCFGFTEEEVFKVMDKLGYDEKEKVRDLYGGYVIGKEQNMYNTWSVLRYMGERRMETYWEDISYWKHIREAIHNNNQIKELLWELADNKTVCVDIHEYIVYDTKYLSTNTILSILLASGYLKVKQVEYSGYKIRYHLAVTNKEVMYVLRGRLMELFRK